LRRDALVSENTLSKSNKEALTAESEAMAKVIELDTKRLQSQKNLTTKISSLQSQAAAEGQKIKDDKIKADEAEKKISDEKAAKQKVLDDEAAVSKAEGLQKISDVEDFYFLKGLEREIAEIERKAEADIIELEALGAKKELIEAIEQESSDRINAIVKAASDETIKTEKETADAKKRLGKEELDAKLNMLGKMADGLSTLSEIAGKETAAGKGLAIAAATIDTIRGGVSAFTGMVSAIPGPVGVALGAVAAAGVVASGFASVKKILAVKVPGGGGGGGSAPSGGGISAPSSGGGFTPNFNVVGASSQNQLAETVAGSTSEPTRAYVVYDDVKKAGDIESNAIAAAGI